MQNEMSRAQEYNNNIYVYVGICFEELLIKNKKKQRYKGPAHPLIYIVD